MKHAAAAALSSTTRTVRSTAATPAEAPANHNARAQEAGTPDDIARRVAQTLAHLTAIRALWGDLQALRDDQRRSTNGRLVGRFSRAFQMLFEAAADPAYAGVFSLVMDDPATPAFDGPAFAYAAARVEGLRTLSEELQRLDALFNDDALLHGARIMEPGLRALALSRTLATHNAAFRTRVAPALKALRSMTAAARRQRRPTKPA